MMGASPHHYKSVLKKANALIATVRDYLDGRGANNLQLPIRTVCETRELAEKCSNMIGQLATLNDELQKDSAQRKNYEDAIKNLEACKEALNKLELEQIR